MNKIFIFPFSILFLTNTFSLKCLCEEVGCTNRVDFVIEPAVDENFQTNGIYKVYYDSVPSLFFQFQFQINANNGEYELAQNFSGLVQIKKINANYLDISPVEGFTEDFENTVVSIAYENQILFNGKLAVDWGEPFYPNGRFCTPHCYWGKASKIVLNPVVIP